MRAFIKAMYSHRDTEMAYCQIWNRLHQGGLGGCSKAGNKDQSGLDDGHRPLETGLVQGTWEELLTREADA